MPDDTVVLPALRGRQGDRTLYVVLPQGGILGATFTPEVVPHDQRDQRALNTKHAQGIASYIVDNRSGYVLGALTYAMDTEAEFVPVVEGAQLGTLQIPVDARLRSVDGQHRREGITRALEDLADVASDNVALLIYVEDDLTKRRQMFSDMNWTARKVTASQNVAFDSRDPFSRVVQQLVRSHPLLADRVEEQQARVPKGSSNLFTLAAVYDAVKRLQVGANGRVKDYASFDEEAVFDRAERFFALLGVRRELAEATTPAQIAELRERSILVSSTTLRVIAGAVHGCIGYHREEGTPFRLEDLREPLLAVDFAPSAEIWQSSGFVSPGRSTPNARNQEVVRATSRLMREFLGLA